MDLRVDLITGGQTIEMQAFLQDSSQAWEQRKHMAEFPSWVYRVDAKRNTNDQGRDMENSETEKKSRCGSPLCML